MTTSPFAMRPPAMRWMKRFKSFVDQVADLAPRVRAKKDGDAMVSLPTLFVGSHVGYQALPLDRELEPFLAVLGDGSAFADRIDPDTGSGCCSCGHRPWSKCTLRPTVPSARPRYPSSWAWPPAATRCG